mmetsp:Transcript_17984/g.47831  ORF Transcript_17984/g.47831 Transcript_17984/m.47831 type:complete len:191 (+) Transcript_17984:299-871(+)
MDQLPSLKTLIAEEKTKPGTTITTLSGDFLMPSILSGMDSGMGMIEALNDVGLDYVCFGSHECDIPNDKVVERVKESNFQWVNSNMRGFATPTPEFVIVPVGSNKVGLLGVCLTKMPGSNYGGAAKAMEPILDCVNRLSAQLTNEGCCAVIPMTYQDQPDDEALAANSAGYPVVLGGYDHGESYSKHGDC